MEDLIGVEQKAAVSSISDPHVPNVQTLALPATIEDQTLPPITKPGQRTEDVVMSESTAENSELMEKQDKLMWEKLLIYAGVNGKTSLGPQRPAPE